MKKFAKKSALFLLTVLCTACFVGGLSACRGKDAPIETIEGNTTIRTPLPNDGSTPAAHTGLENIGYMAYVLDNQPFYHAYAYNSSKAMGYEQITQTWKDYKSEAESGIEGGVMICSDLTYSTFVKAGTQACFVGDSAAYMRTSSKPGKDTTATTAEWSSSQPTYYDKESYLHKYGEFSTELSVYVINETTLQSADDVVVNSDGTYSQTFYLKEDAACWYQYGMKTRGDLKGYPEFESIVITFTFDKDWQVLSSYCEEKTKIAPSSLGGMGMTSNSKTTTTFGYGAEEFDDVHYGYINSFFKQYFGKLTVGDGTPSDDTPEMLDVLGNAFSGVVNPEGDGQQFALDLTVGETQYTGKVYLKLADMSNIAGTLDLRVALEKAGSGKQDLYLEYRDGSVNVYYSDRFAMTANIDAVKTVVGQLAEWFDRFTAITDAPDGAVVEEESSMDVSSLLSALSFTYTDTSATVALSSENLLGMGIGIDANIKFSRNKSEGTYSFVSASLNSITYDERSIKLTAAITPDGSAKISHNASSTSANLAEYVSSVYNMLNSETLKVTLSLDGTQEGVLSYLDGIKADATAYVILGTQLSAKADVSAEYKGISAKVTAYYTVDLDSGDYGDVYLTLTELNGVPMNAKIYCNINETADAISQLLSSLETSVAAEEIEEGAESSLADLINKVLCLNFGAILGDIYATNSQIRVSVNIDELMNGLGLDSGLNFGTAALALGKNAKGEADLSLALPALGLAMNVAGSSETVTLPSDEGYVNVTELIDFIKKVASEAEVLVQAKDLVFDIDATIIADGIPFGIVGTGEVSWNGAVRVALDAELFIADGTTSSAKDTIAVKLLYDESAENEPLIRLALNDLALDIYREDISGGTTDNNSSSSSGGSIDADALLDFVCNILKEITVELEYSENGGISGVLVRYAANGCLTLGSDNNFSLGLNVTDNNGTDIALINADITAGSGDLFGTVGKAISGYTVYSTAQKDDFTKVLYDYILSVIENVTIRNVLGSDTYKVNVNFSGKDCPLADLDGVYVSATLSYSEGADGKLISADVNLSFPISIDGEEQTVSAKVAVAYSGNYIFAELKEINGNSFAVKVKAHKDDLYSLAQYLLPLIAGSVSDTATVSDGQSLEISNLINNLLSLNPDTVLRFNRVNGLNTITVYTDNLLSAFGMDAHVGDIVGAVNPDTHEVFAYVIDDYTAWLSLHAYVSAVNEYGRFNPNEYIDIIDALQLVKAAKAEAEKIIEAEDAVFVIDATVIIDGMPFGMVGTGEVSWKDDNIRLVLDVELFVANGVSSDQKDTVAIKFIYDSTANSAEPFVRLAINSIGLDISQNNLDELSDTVSTIKEAIQTLLGNQNASTNDAATAAAVAGGASLDFEEILQSPNAQMVINYALELVENLAFSLKYTGEEVSGLIVSHITNGGMVIGANGNLSFNLNLTDDNGADILNAIASVKAGDGSTFNSVNATLDGDGYEKCTGYTFTEVVYNYLFAVIENVSIKNVLGNSTYTINFELDGDESAIPELEGVRVQADLYYTEGVVGGEITGKLAEADVTISVDGVSVSFDVYYFGEYLYISLNEVGSTELSGIKVKADVHDVYSAAAELVNIITNTDIMEMLSGYVTSGNSVAANTAAVAAVEENTTDTLSAVISALLNTDFSKALAFTNVDGINQATVELDYLLSAFGVAPEYAVGTLTTEIDPQTHAFSANVTGTGDPWLTVKAEKATKRDYSDFFADNYIDIGFISYLISDLGKTMTDDGGNVYTLYTFSGDFSLAINYASIIKAAIEFDNMKVTAGLDEKGDFYLTMLADLQKSTYLTFTVAAERTISATVTVVDGTPYITLGREIGTTSVKYKVMTLNYFIDNMFSESDSPLRWLLGTSDYAWGLITSALGDKVSGISSGLTAPVTYYLFEELTQTVTEQVGLADYINGLCVNVGGNTISSYGKTDAVAGKLEAKKSENGFDITGNYYAVDIDAKGLTGVLTTLYAALLRDDSQGITGLVAYGAIDSYVTFNLNLGTYLENSVPESVAAENYFASVSKTYNISFAPNGNSIFGCFNTEDLSYAYSQLLEQKTLTIYGLDGVTTYSVELPVGSTVVTYSPFAPVWANDAHTAIVNYEYADGSATGVSFILNGDTTIYAVPVVSNEVNFVIGGLNGIDTLNGAFAAGAELPEYELIGYTFLGWYEEQSYGTLVTNQTAGITTVYGKYAKTQVTGENGVVYTFVPDGNGGGSYQVSGYDKTLIEKYTVSGSVLEIANEIEGYKVTAIGDYAFAYLANAKDAEENPGVGAGLKNVIVPENVTLVGERAFLDNYGIETVVFLADSVRFEGSVSGKTLPFYGCSTGNGTTSTELKIYYIVITSDVGSEWSHFRTDGTYYYYVGIAPKSGVIYHYENGGGALISSGWAYVNYTLNGVAYSLGDIGLANGINTAEFNNTTLAAYITAQLDEITKQEEGGYTNKYSVEISEGAYVLDGKVHNITITVTLNDSSEWLGEVEVTFSFNLENVSLASETLNRGDELPTAPEVSNYTFLGWFADENYTTPITVHDGKLSQIYGRYAINAIIVNGVVYTLTQENDGYVYHITGHDDLSAYTPVDSWLILENDMSGIPENDIAGIPVTAIEASAFKGTLIKNVVVPENIVTVGAQAFMDNYDMRTVVFLAETVHLGGTSSTGDTDRYVFFGCSIDDNGTTTNLTVYYNNITNDDPTNWNCFRTTSSWGTTTYYHLGEGSELISSGWAYVDYAFKGIDSPITDFEGRVDGINTSLIYVANIKANLIEAINTYTSEQYGYINAYGVEVLVTDDNGTEYSDNLVLDGNRYTVTITVSKQTAWYAFTVTSETSACEVKFTSEYVQNFNGTDYVMADTTVIVTATDDSAGIYEFVAWTGVETFKNANAKQTTFVMPSSTCSVLATWQAAYADNTYVYSEVDFTYNGNYYDIEKDGEDGTVKLTNAAVGASLAAPTAEGFTFLGWATETNGTFTIVDSVKVTKSEYAKYYALWVASREDVTFTQNGLSLTATVKSGYDGSVYGWYAGTDDTFVNTALSTGNAVYELSASHTAVRIRLQYTLTVKTYVSGSVYSIEQYINGSKVGTNTSSYSYEVKVPEKANIFVFDYDYSINSPQKKVFKIYMSTDTLDEATLANYTVVEYNGAQYVQLVDEIRIKAKTGITASLETKELRLFLGDYSTGTEWTAWGYINNALSMTADTVYTFCYIR